MPRLNSIFSSTPDVLSLAYIRSILQRLEDTILFQLIERGQNAHNAAMYKPGAFKELQEKEGWERSWVEWFLKETESIHAKLRRWQAPDEYPFTDIKLLPEPILPPVVYPEVLYSPAIVTVNDQIYQHYRDELVPALTSRFGPVSVLQSSLYFNRAHLSFPLPQDSDDNQYGSAAVRDVEALAALSKRIHFGEIAIYD